MSNATLIAHVGGKYRTREELDGLETPEGTRTWRPVPHHELVRELAGGLEAAGIGIVRERYATMGRTDAKLFGALDLACPTFDTEDFRLALGLRAANDQSMKIQVVTGARVFVCDNMAFSGTGGAVMLARKHTSGLDLSREVPRAVDQFLEKAEAFRLDLGRMREIELPDGAAKELIHDAFAGKRPALPVRLFPEVARLYFDDPEQRERFPDRTLWSLSNSFTEAVKSLRPGQQHLRGHEVGRYFGRALRRYVRAGVATAAEAN
jgi:hypothetical protein